MRRLGVAVALWLGACGGGSDGGGTAGTSGGAAGKSGGAAGMAAIAGTTGSAGMSGSAAGTTGGPAAGASGSVVPVVIGAGLFPSTAPFYKDISNAPLDRESKQVIDGLAAHGGWGNGNAMQIDFSITVLGASDDVVVRPFTPTGDFFTPDCDPIGVPLPPGGRVEGYSDYACGGGDCHLIVVQGKRLYEMWRANVSGGKPGGNFRGGCLAVWDLTRDYWQPPSKPVDYARGEQCSSADAAGFPITALLFSADEVAAGEIKHAIRFILPNERIRDGEYVHPATHSGAGKGTPNAAYVPYGARLRLRADFPLSSLPNEGARTVARAMQRYGMFLADGGDIALTAQDDRESKAKWDGLLGPRDLRSLKVTDFAMVDGGTRIPLTLDCTRTPLAK